MMAYNVREMSRIDPSTMVYNLNVKEDYESVKQK